MPTVHRAHGLRFVIFTDDHEPAHIHAIGAGGEVKISLGEASGRPEIVWAKGLSKADVSRALSEVRIESARLREAWIRIHGGVE